MGSALDFFRGERFEGSRGNDAVGGEKDGSDVWVGFFHLQKFGRALFDKRGPQNEVGADSYNECSVAVEGAGDTVHGAEFGDRSAAGVMFFKEAGQ